MKPTNDNNIVRGFNSNLSPQLRAELNCVSPIIDRFVCLQCHVILSSEIVDARNKVRQEVVCNIDTAF